MCASYRCWLNLARVVVRAAGMCQNVEGLGQRGFRYFIDGSRSIGRPGWLIRKWSRKEGLLERASEASSIGKPRLWSIGLAFLLTALMIPILIVEVPPLTDYPNHLARAYFLAFQSVEPVLQKMFSVHWAVIPNLAVDLILLPLMHIFPPLMAGKIVVALAIALPTTGTIALSFA